MLVMYMIHDMIHNMIHYVIHALYMIYARYNVIRFDILVILSLWTNFGKLFSKTAAVDPFNARCKVFITPRCHDSIGWLLAMLSGVFVWRPIDQQFHGCTQYSFHSVRSFGFALISG